ncbi:unnamed protein product [Peniophora sp. CBMAI 1063]|nr:unnamed protein product [Peniophora sp. CBMAI 1063]
MVGIKEPVKTSGMSIYERICAEASLAYQSYLAPQSYGIETAYISDGQPMDEYASSPHYSPTPSPPPSLLSLPSSPSSSLSPSRSYNADPSTSPPPSDSSHDDNAIADSSPTSPDDIAPPYPVLLPYWPGSPAPPVAPIKSEPVATIDPRVFDQTQARKPKKEKKKPEVKACYDCRALRKKCVKQSDGSLECQTCIDHNRACLYPLQSFKGQRTDIILQKGEQLHPHYLNHRHIQKHTEKKLRARLQLGRKRQA